MELENWARSVDEKAREKSIIKNRGLIELPGRGKLRIPLSSMGNNENTIGQGEMSVPKGYSNARALLHSFFFT